MQSSAFNGTSYNKIVADEFSLKTFKLGLQSTRAENSVGVGTSAVGGPRDTSNLNKTMKMIDDVDGNFFKNRHLSLLS